MRYRYFLMLVMLSLTLHATHATTNPLVISPENASQVQELAVYGKGSLGEVAWSSRGVIAVQTSMGIWIFESLEDDEPSLLAGDFRAINFSPDGSILLLYTQSMSTEAQIHFFNTATWQESLIIPVRMNGIHQGNYVTEMILSHNNQKLFTISSELRYYDLTSPDFAHEIWGESPTYFPDMDLSHDESILSLATFDGFSYFYDVNSGEVLQIIEPQSGFGTKRVDLSPDANLMLMNACEAQCFNAEVLVWNRAEARTMARIVDVSILSSNAAFSPDGQYIITKGRTDTLWVWSAETYELLYRLPMLTNPEIRYDNGRPHFAFSPDGNSIITTGSDERLLVWNLQTGDLIQELSPQEFGKALAMTIPLDNAQADVILLHYDGYWENSGNQNELRWLDMDTGGIMKQVDFITAGVSFALWDTLGTNIITQTFGAIHSRQRETAEIENEFFNNSINTVATISADSRILAFADCPIDPTYSWGCEQTEDAWYLSMRDAETLNELHHFQLGIALNQRVTQLILSPDGAMSAVLDNTGMLSIWDNFTGEQIAENLITACGIYGYQRMVFLPENQLIYADGCSTLYRWDYGNDSGESFFRSPYTIRKIILSPNGRLLALQDEESLVLFDSETGAALTRFATPSIDISFNAAGTAIIGMGEQIRLWGIPQNE